MVCGTSLDCQGSILCSPGTVKDYYLPDIACGTEIECGSEIICDD